MTNDNSHNFCARLLSQQRGTKLQCVIAFVVLGSEEQPHETENRYDAERQHHSSDERRAVEMLRYQTRCRDVGDILSCVCVGRQL